jgi:hypothetical protein
MENQFQKKSGISLMFGSALMVATMVLHPAGGSIAQILKMLNIIIIAHSLAIFTLPFVAFGFYGLTISLLGKSQLSMLSFIIICFALIAGLMAASINGLAIPIFLSKVVKDISYDENLVKSLLNLAFSLNKAMDYVFVVGCSVSMGIWSSLIIKGTFFPKWLGYYGILLIVFAVIAASLSFSFINLFGFRIFIFGMVSWIIGIGYFLKNSRTGF